MEGNVFQSYSIVALDKLFVIAKENGEREE